MDRRQSIHRYYVFASDWELVVAVIDETATK